MIYDIHMKYTWYTHDVCGHIHGILYIYVIYAWYMTYTWYFIYTHTWKHIIYVNMFFRQISSPGWWSWGLRRWRWEELVVAWDKIQWDILNGWSVVFTMSTANPTTLWWAYKKLWKITIFNGQIPYKWPFSIAMLVYQRVLYGIDWSFNGDLLAI